MDWIHLVQEPVLGDSTLAVPPFKFVKTTIKDYASIAETIVNCGDFTVSAPEFYARAIRTLIAGYIVKIEKQEPIIACATLSMWAGFPGITFLWVAPEFRRQGLGFFLTNMCMLRTKANTYHRLHTYLETSRVPALELFKKAQFVEEKHL